ncbi:MAG: T9SS type A sorting domain-containing protein [Flavobacteriaceae bacterium]|nr:T9SS type A sorting domain-containing protein [Flavobacteriaceae bacterium]
MAQKLQFKKYVLAFYFLLVQTCLISISAQTLMVSDNTAGATDATYTFTYTTTGTIGEGSSTPNIFYLLLPSGFPSIVNTIADSNLLGSNVVLNVNGSPITIDATTFGLVGGAWSSGIQMSTAGGTPGLTIPAGATIEVIITGILINPATDGIVTFNWATLEGGGVATESYSADVTFGTLSINDDFNVNSNVKVYPNPFNNIVNIDTESNSKIEIYNLLGKRILTQSINRGNSQLDMSKYANGVYIVKITNENNQIKTLKIIKK